MNYTILDFETSNYSFGSAFDPRNFPVALVVLSVHEGERTLLKYHYLKPEISNCTLDEIASLLEESKHDRLDHTMVGHHLKFDLHWCNRLDLDYNKNKVADTMFKPYLDLEGGKGRLSLGALSGTKDRLGEILVHDYGICPSTINPTIILDYCVKDVLATEKLWIHWTDGNQCLESSPTRTTLSKPHQLMCDVLPVLVSCEQNGFKLDLALLKSIHEDQLQVQEEQIVELRKVLKDRFGIEEFNPNSHAQISQLLFSLKLIKEKRGVWAYFFENFNPFGKDAETEYRNMLLLCFESMETGLKITPPLRAMGNFSLSTDLSTLKELVRTHGSHPDIEILNQFYAISRQKTLISTFIEGVLGGGPKDKDPKYYLGNDGAYLHTSYNQTTTATGRLSSSNPNLQNWPREGTFPIRRCVISRFEGGSIASADASQIELRYAGWYYGDDNMRSDFENGVDIHGSLARLVYGANYSDENRTNSKKVVFRVLYRGGANGIVSDPSIPIYDLEEVKAIIEAIYGRYTQLKEGQEQDLLVVGNQEGNLRTPTGRRYRFDVGKYNLRNKVANYPIQGGATGDFIPCAMIVCKGEMDDKNVKSLMIGQVHDDLIFDVYPGEEELIEQIATFALTDGGKWEFNNRFGLNFDFPLDSEWKIKEHW